MWIKGGFIESRSWSRSWVRSEGDHGKEADVIRGNEGRDSEDMKGTR